MPQANSTTSRPRATSPRGVRGDLAVLGGDQRGQLVAVRVGQLAEREQDAARAVSDVSRQPGERRRRRPDGRSTSLRGGQLHLGRLLAGGRVEHRERCGHRPLPWMIRSASLGRRSSGSGLPRVVADGSCVGGLRT